MTVIATQNLNAHYTTNSKVQRPLRNVAVANTNLPHTHVFDDRDANKRLSAINNDIYTGAKREKRRKDYAFGKIFGGLVLAVLGFKGIQKLITFFK